MACDIPDIGALEYLAGLPDRPRPYVIVAELTQRCNNRCLHCYCDPALRAHDLEQPTQFWLDLLDVLVAEDCLWLVLTGGEPLLRPDFARIYETAKRKGFVVSVFTNGRALTEPLADLLAELPPRVVSVSLYGATAETYEAVSRVPGSHAEAMAGIRRLHDRGVRGELKGMALRRNFHEIGQIADLARELGWPFRFDPGVVPARDTGAQVLEERLSPEEVVELDLADAERMQEWRQRWARTAGASTLGNQLFLCPAGRRTAYVGAGGALSPCGVLSARAWPLDPGRLRESFRAAFYQGVARLGEETAEGEYPCGRCQAYALCGVCAGWREIEMGDPRRPSDFGCRLAALRAQRFGFAVSLPEGCPPGPAAGG